MDINKKTNCIRFKHRIDVIFEREVGVRVLRVVVFRLDNFLRRVSAAKLTRSHVRAYNDSA